MAILIWSDDLIVPRVFGDKLKMQMRRAREKRGWKEEGGSMGGGGVKGDDP